MRLSEGSKKVESITEKKASRRQMVKWMGALAAGAGIGFVAGIGGDAILRPSGLTTTTTVPAVSTTAAPAEQFAFSPCFGSGCHEFCLLKVYFADGKIDRAERYDLPQPEGDYPGICQKGVVHVRMPYWTTRLLYPLKRTGNRGEGKFERITWDQAMNEIGAKLRAIRDQYGSKAVWIPHSLGAQADNMGESLAYRFANVFGATVSNNWGMAPIDTAQIWELDFEGWPNQHTPTVDSSNYTGRLFAEAKYFIVWSNNPMANRCGTAARYILQAQYNGAKLVVIGLAFDATAAKADQFIQVRGGTDTALALAMDNVLVQENLYDYDFMAKHTVGPFLVRDDNGRFLRESDIVSGGDSTKYVYWEPVAAKPQSIGGYTYAFPIGTQPDLLAAPVVNGIACKTAFLKLKENLAKYTPQWQEGITGVPAKTVTDLAHEYVTNKPAAILQDHGMRYQNAGRATRAIWLLGALSGNMGLRGGRVVGGFTLNSIGYPIALNTAGVTNPEGQKLGDFSRSWTDIISAITTGNPYPIRAMLHGGANSGNPVHAAPSRQIQEELLSKLDLNVVYEIRMTETARWADYVLPDATLLEKYGIRGQYNSIFLQEPVIAPLGEAKSSDQYWKLIAQQVGLDKYFTNTLEEYCQIMLNSPHPTVAGIKPPATWERLKKEKVIRGNVPVALDDAYADLTFMNYSGRYEFYNEGAAEIGEALAQWVVPWKDKPENPDSKYPLQYITARNRFFMQTMGEDDPLLAKLADEKKPLLRISPADASARGIKEGDVVEAFNSRGSFKAYAHFSEIYPPGVVSVWFGLAKQDFIAGHSGYLLAPQGTPETSDELINKFHGGDATITRGWHLHYTGWDLLWDNRCEVRKSTATTT